jgi:hypothetical protein
MVTRRILIDKQQHNTHKKTPAHPPSSDTKQSRAPPIPSAASTSTPHSTSAPRISAPTHPAVPFPVPTPPAAFPDGAGPVSVLSTTVVTFPVPVPPAAGTSVVPGVGSGTVVVSRSVVVAVGVPDDGFWGRGEGEEEEEPGEVVVVVAGGVGDEEVCGAEEVARVDVVVDVVDVDGLVGGGAGGGDTVSMLARTSSDEGGRTKKRHGTYHSRTCPIARHWRCSGPHGHTRHATSTGASQT